MAGRLLNSVALSAVRRLPHQRLAGLEHVKEHAFAPPLANAGLLNPARGRHVCAGTAVPLSRQFGRIVPEAKDVAFVDRMQRVDQNMRTSNRDARRNGAFAKSGDNVPFRQAGQPRLGEPGNQCVELVISDRHDSLACRQFQTNRQLF